MLTELGWCDEGNVHRHLFAVHRQLCFAVHHTFRLPRPFRQQIIFRLYRNSFKKLKVQLFVPLLVTLISPLHILNWFSRRWVYKERDGLQIGLGLKSLVVASVSFPSHSDFPFPFLVHPLLHHSPSHWLFPGSSDFASHYGVLVFLFGFSFSQANSHRWSGKIWKYNVIMNIIIYQSYRKARNQKKFSEGGNRNFF